MNDSPKKAGLLAWLMLTGVAAAPGLAQDRTAPTEAGTEAEAAEDEAEPVGEVSEGSGEAPEVSERRRRHEMSVKAAPHRNREHANK